MKIVKIIRSNHALTFRQGEKVRDRIIKKLYYGKRVTLDCGGLICLTTDFIHPITDLLALYPKSKLKQNLRIINLNKFHTSQMQHCIHSTLKLKRQ